MSFFTETQGKVEHEYFQAGPGKKIYLGRKDRPQSIKLENIRKAMEYVNKRNRHYFQIMDQLVSRLPKEDRDKILPEIIEELYRAANKHISSMSESAARKYRQKGRRP